MHFQGAKNLKTCIIQKGKKILLPKDFIKSKYCKEIQFHKRSLWIQNIHYPFYLFSFSFPIWKCRFRLHAHNLQVIANEIKGFEHNNQHELFNTINPLNVLFLMHLRMCSGCSQQSMLFEIIIKLNIVLYAINFEVLIQLRLNFNQLH